MGGSETIFNNRTAYGYSARLFRTPHYWGVGGLRKSFIMPEGPEVRRHADALHAAFAGKTITALTARTKAAKAWLAEMPHQFPNQRVLWVRSHGKNLVGQTEGGPFWYSHLMMWGRWQVFDAPPEAIDRRERARITADDQTCAVLFSAPVFEVGESEGRNPFSEHPYLRVLGPDILPYPGTGDFAADCFRERLLTPEHMARQIGAVLLDQNVLAGVGNYLRAEILWVCQISPFVVVAELTEAQLSDLCRVIPEIARRAYELRGQSVTPEDREKCKATAPIFTPTARTNGGAAITLSSEPICRVCGAAKKSSRSDR